MSEGGKTRFDPRPGEEPHGRLHWFTLDELDADQRAFVDELTSGPRGTGNIDEKGRLTGMYNARLLDPPVGTAYQKLTGALRFESRIAKNARWREIVILETFRHGHNNFEWGGHSKMARAEGGLNDQDLEAIRTGGDSPTFTPEDRLLRRIVGSILETRDVPDALYEEAKRVLGLPILFDAVTLCLQYHATTLAFKIWRVPVPKGTVLAFEPEY